MFWVSSEKGRQKGLPEIIFYDFYLRSVLIRDCSIWCYLTSEYCFPSKWKCSKSPMWRSSLQTQCRVPGFEPKLDKRQLRILAWPTTCDSIRLYRGISFLGLAIVFASYCLSVEWIHENKKSHIKNDRGLRRRDLQLFWKDPIYFVYFTLGFCRVFFL